MNEAYLESNAVRVEVAAAEGDILGGAAAAVVLAVVALPVVTFRFREVRAHPA
jgi:hypothetical protein